MTNKQARELKPGVYRLFRKRGEDEIAVVGIGFQGQRWYATPNGCGQWDFVTGRGGVCNMRRYKAGSTDWGSVARVVPVLCVDVEAS